MDKKIKKIAKSLSKEIYNQYDTGFMSESEEELLKSNIKSLVKEGAKDIVKAAEKNMKKELKKSSKTKPQIIFKSQSEAVEDADKVIVNKNLLASYIEAYYQLSALEAGGVDNWSYYSEALHEEVPDEYEDVDDYYHDEALKLIGERTIPYVENTEAAPTKVNSDSLYLVFGDDARSDGDNIKGIFLDRSKAEEFARENDYLHYNGTPAIENFEIDNFEETAEQDEDIER